MKLHRNMRITTIILLFIGLSFYTLNYEESYSSNEEPLCKLRENLFISNNNNISINPFYPLPGSTNRTGAIIKFNITVENDIDVAYYSWDNNTNVSFSSPYRAYFPESEGNHFIAVYANDTMGNDNLVEFNYFVDNTGPNVTITNYDNNTIHESGTEFSLNISDDSGLDSENCCWYNWDGVKNYTLHNHFENNISLIFGNGSHILNVFAKDALGNINRKSFNFTTSDPSYKSPTILSYDVDFDSIIKPNLILDFEIGDSNGLGQVHYQWNNLTNTSLTAPFDIPVPAINGDANLVIIANDSLGYSTYEMYNFIIDSTTPYFRLNNSVNNSVHCANFPLQVNVTDEISGNDTIVTYHWDNDDNQTLSSNIIYTPSEHGWHNLSLYATDKGGNKNSTIYRFKVDTIAPEINLNSTFSNNSIIKNGTVINFEITDDDGVSQTRLEFDSFPQGDIYYPYNVPINGSDGNINVTLIAEDNCGNIEFASFNFSLDGTAPTIDVNSPINETVQQNNFNIEFNITDSNGIDTVFYGINNSANEILESPYILSIDENDGPILIEIIANDSLGNYGEPIYFEYTIDSQIPNIELLNAINYHTYNSEKNISLNIYDKNGLSNVHYNWDNGINQSFSEEWIVNLPDVQGTHNLYIFANDSASNYNETVFTFTVDDSKPQILLISPENNTVQKPNTLIDFDISDDNTLDEVYYSWNYQPYSVFEPSYDLFIPSTDGWNFLKIWANDTIGNYQEKDYAFFSDSDTPLINLNNSNNNSIIFQGFELKLNIVDNGTIDTALYRWDTNSDAILISPYNITCPGTEGIHELIIFANDTAGNCNYSMFYFTVDCSKPEIHLTNYLNNSIVPNDFSLEFDISDNYQLTTVKYKWNYEPWSNFEAPYNLSSWRNHGEHTLFVWANDSAGNERNLTYTFIIDHYAPDIIIENLFNNTIQIPNYEIMLNITDDYLINYSYYTWDSGEITEFENGDPVNFPMNEGNHTLFVFSNDSVGNFETLRYNFYTDCSGPSIEFINFLNNSYYRPYTLFNTSIHDVSDVDYVSYHWDSNESTFIEPPYSFEIQAFSGFHTLYIYANDSIGNENSIKFEFIIDNQNPNVNLLGISNDTIIGNNTLIHFTIEDDYELNLVHYRWDYNQNWSTMDEPYDIMASMADGTHYLSINATDTAENSIIKTFNFTIDGLKPNILLLNHENNSYHIPETIIQFNIADINGISEANYSWDGINYCSFQVNYQVTLPETIGEYDLFIKASDFAGNKDELMYHFFIDDQFPNIELISHQNETAILNGTLLEFNIENADNVSYSWNWGSIQNLESNSLLVDFSYNGHQYLEMEANRTNGWKCFKYFTFYLDNQSPFISLNSPENNNVNKSGTPIRFSIYDDYKIDTVWYNWDSGKNSTLENPYYLEFPTFPGNHTLMIYANDSVNNEICREFNFRTDDQPPIIEIFNSANNSVIIGEYKLIFNISDMSNVSYMLANWDNNSYQAIWEPYYTYAPLSTGIHNLSIFVNDTLNNSFIYNYTFEIDSEFPSISPINFINNSCWSNNDLLKFNTDDNLAMSEVVFQWDSDNETTFININAPYEISTALSDGNHTLYLRASDSVGNTKLVSYNITIDSLAPSITLISPLNGQAQVPGAQIEIDVYDLNNLHETRYSWDGINYDLMNYPYILSLPEEPGNYRLYINASDEIINYQIRTFDFEVDDKIPIISLLQIVNNSYITNGTYIKFKIQNFDQVFYSINGSTSQSFYAPFEIFVNEWQETDQIITISANYSTGVWITSEYHFIVDNTPPEIFLLSPEENTVDSGSGIIQFSFEDNFDLDYVQYGWNNEEIMHILEEPFSIDFYDQYGSNTLHIYAFDTAGLSREKEYSFLTDNRSPYIYLLNSQNFDSHKSSYELDFYFYDEFCIKSIKYRWRYQQWNTLWFNQELASINETMKISLPEVGGLNQLEVIVEDFNGNYISKMYYIYTDDVAPVIEIPEFDNYSMIRAGQNIQLTIDDANENLSVMYKWNNQDYQYLIDTNEIEMIKGKGIQKLTIRVIDEAGNEQISDFYFESGISVINLIFIIIGIVTAISILGFIGIKGYQNQVAKARKISSEFLENSKKPHYDENLLILKREAQIIQQDLKFLSKRQLNEEKKLIEEKIKTIDMKIRDKINNNFIIAENMIQKRKYDEASKIIDEEKNYIDFIGDQDIITKAVSIKERIKTAKSACISKDIIEKINKVDKLVKLENFKQALTLLEDLQDKVNQYELHDLKPKISRKITLIYSFKKLTELFSISERIKLDDLAEIMDMRRSELINHLIDWKSIFKDLKLVGDEVVLGKHSNMDGFVDLLDKQYESWDKKERSGSGKKI